MRAAFEHWWSQGELDPAVFDPDIEWRTRSDLPDTGVYRGYAEIGELNSSWADSFDDYQVEPRDLIDAGDHVVIPIVIRGRVKGTDVPVEQEEVWVATFREGRIVQVREYRTMSEAQEAIGVSQAGSRDPASS